VSRMSMCSILLAICFLVAVNGLPTTPPDSGRNPEEGDFFGGDMKLTDDQLQALQGEGHHRNAVINPFNHWPNGVINYELMDMESSDKDLIRDSLAKLATQTDNCLQFNEVDIGDRVQVFNRGGCSSNVGYLNRVQSMNLGGGCVYRGIIQHEFLHTAGILHTQSRDDRDDYVEILYDNIIPENAYNFDKVNPQIFNHRGMPYDFSSVMHYGAYGFSINGRMTIRTIDPSKQGLLGQRNGVSEGDVELIKKMYGCSGSGSGCVTDAGPCVFPFIYKGVTYNECTEVEDPGYPWCSVKTNEDNEHVDFNKDYGYCPSECGSCSHTNIYPDDECENWKEDGDCVNGWRQWMETNCAKTCLC